MIEIVLYKTTGCKSCEIMERLLREAAPQDCKITVKEGDRQTCRNLGIYDYPTTFVYKDDEKVLEFVGTYPKQYISEHLAPLM